MARRRGDSLQAVHPSKGGERGGLPFSRGAVFHLLRNRLYVGEVVHKGESYPGAHPAIVDPELFEVVQKALDARCSERRPTRARPGSSPLKGVLYDAEGQPMSPTTAQGKSGRRYRYYVSSALQKGVALSTEVTRRVSAAALEALLTQRLQRFAQEQARSRPGGQLGLAPVRRRSAEQPGRDARVRAPATVGQ